MFTSDARASGGRLRAALWEVVVALALAFVGIARGVLVHHRFAFDAPILVWLHGHESPGLTLLARVLTRVGDPTTVGAATALVVVALVAMWRLWDMVTFAVEVGGAAVLDLAGKQVFARPRPVLFPHLVHESNFGFPSGHAVGDVAFFLALFLLVERIAPGRWRLAGLGGVALAFVIGASRPYLQVHYPTDVLAGWALGLAWTIAVDLLVAPVATPRVALADGVWARSAGRRGVQVRVWGRRGAERLTWAALLDRTIRRFGPDVNVVVERGYRRQLESPVEDGAPVERSVGSGSVRSASVASRRGETAAAAGRERRPRD